MMRIKKFLKDNLWFICFWVFLIVIFNIRLPYYVSASGGVIDISDRIDVDNIDDNVNGSLNMLYVVEYEAIIPIYLLSYFMEDWEVQKISDFQLSDENQEEIQLRNKIMLDNSIQNAIFVAYEEAGRNIEITGYDNYIIGTTLDNGLKIGDKIVKVNDIEVLNINEIKKIIMEAYIGEKVEMTILRDGKEIEVSCEVVEEEGNKIIGVAMVTNYQYELDPEIEISFKKSESGSSGGLMMALSIYNAISGEDLVRGRNIAGTGTIDMNGNVGRIDGIKYKLKGAVKNGMDVVLVPESNYEEAIAVKKEKGYEIDIVKVSTFDDAINYLRNN